MRIQLSLGSIIFLTKTKLRSRDEALHFAESLTHDFLCPLMMLTRLAVGLEPLNALDAAHRSPRSLRFRETKLVPPQDRQLVDQLSENKELMKLSTRVYRRQRKSLAVIVRRRRKNLSGSIPTRNSRREKWLISL